MNKFPILIIFLFSLSRMAFAQPVSAQSSFIEEEKAARMTQKKNALSEQNEVLVKENRQIFSKNRTNCSTSKNRGSIMLLIVSDLQICFEGNGLEWNFFTISGMLIDRTIFF